MVQPLEVKHAKFPVDSVIYNGDGFSVVWGIWDDGEKGLGMRWNESPGPNGFPTSGDHFRPVWLVIPLDLSVPFVTSLLGKPFADNNVILKVLQELEAHGKIPPKP